MIVKHAKEAAQRWVTEVGSKTPGFLGAYQPGSTNTLPDDAEFPASSDVDIMVVLSQPDRREKLGKFIYRDAILEVSYVPSDQIESPDQVLGNYHRAGGFRTPNIISDTTGQLTRLQEAVSRDFAKRRWVYKRCEDAMSNTRGYLQWVNEAPLYHDQVTCWLFGTAGPTNVLLAAGLKDPTVRCRYMAARELLADYGRLDFYETLLELQGSAQMRRERVEYHLDAVTNAFDVAKTVVKTPYRFASDISDAARPISIGGSWELIERGFHREAVYWIMATYCRCLTILHNDASLETQERFSQSLRELLGDLGIASFADLQQRSEQVKGFLPRVCETAEAIVAANPRIEDWAMTEPVELRTERLLLRPFKLDDVEDVFTYASDPEWARYLPAPQPYVRQDAEEFVAQRVLASWDTGPVWALVLTGRVIGGIGLRINLQHETAELGYSVG